MCVAVKDTQSADYALRFQTNTKYQTAAMNHRHIYYKNEVNLIIGLLCCNQCRTVIVPNIAVITRRQYHLRALNC